MESFWWQFLKRGAFSDCHISLLLFASATKRNVKIQLHVCNLHYTKESLGLYHSTFPSNMIISRKCINHWKKPCINRATIDWYQHVILTSNLFNYSAKKLDNRNQVKIKKISMIFHGFYCTLKIPEEKAFFFRVV